MIIAALLAVGLQIENYLPGSPARLEPHARQLLESALLPFEEAEVWQLDLREGSFRWRYQFIAGQGAWRQAVQIENSPLPNPETSWVWLPASGLEFEARIAACTPLLHWVGASPATPSRRSSSASQDGQAEHFLDTVRDGWQHQLRLDKNLRPVSWISHSDAAWGRPDELSCQVISWQSLRTDALPKRDLDDRVDPSPAGHPHALTPDEMQDWLKLPAEQALSSWLRGYTQNRGVDFNAEIVMQVGEADQATEYGRLQLHSRLIWPAYGQLEFRGKVGIGEDARAVHTQIRGDGSRYWHWDRSESECKQLNSLADMLAGMQGVLPLYAWAARDLPASGLEARWDEDHPRRLHCIDGPHELQFDFDQAGQLQACTVVARDARAGAPRMVYRIRNLRGFAPAAADFGFDWRSDGFGAAVNRAQLEQARDDPRLESLLEPGAVAPQAEWTRAEETELGNGDTIGAESVQDFEGRWLVVCFFNADPWTSGPVLRALHRLRGKLDRDADQIAFRAIGCQGSEDELRAVWCESPIAIPLGLAQSRVFHRAWHLRWYPCTYLIAPNGSVVDRWLGMPSADLESRLNRELRRR